MANKYYSTDAAAEFFDSKRPKDISKKGEVYQKPTKAAASAKFTPYRDVGGKADNDFNFKC